MLRPLTFVLASLALALPSLAAAQSPDEQFQGISREPQASLPDIEDEVMCPICGVTRA